MSRALYLPSHYPIHSHYAYYPDYFVSIYNAYKEGNEEILKKYEELPQESFELIIEELLKVLMNRLIHE